MAIAIEEQHRNDPVQAHASFGAEIPEVTIKWHTSAKDISDAYQSGFIAEVLNDPEFADTTKEDIEQGNWVLDDGTEITDAESLAAMSDLGFWGFCDNKNVVHVWPGSLQGADLAMLIGHEIGHLVGEKCDNEDEEEKRADLFGLVAKRAFEMISERPT